MLDNDPHTDIKKTPQPVSGPEMAASEQLDKLPEVAERLVNSRAGEAIRDWSERRAELVLDESLDREERDAEVAGLDVELERILIPAAKLLGQEGEALTELKQYALSQVAAVTMDLEKVYTDQRKIWWDSAGGLTVALWREIGESFGRDAEFDRLHELEDHWQQLQAMMYDRIADDLTQIEDPLKRETFEQDFWAQVNQSAETAFELGEQRYLDADRVAAQFQSSLGKHQVNYEEMARVYESLTVKGQRSQGAGGMETEVSEFQDISHDLEFKPMLKLVFDLFQRKYGASYEEIKAEAADCKVGKLRGALRWNDLAGVLSDSYGFDVGVIGSIRFEPMRVIKEGFGDLRKAGKALRGLAKGKEGSKEALENLSDKYGKVGEETGKTVLAHVRYPLTWALKKRNEEAQERWQGDKDRIKQSWTIVKDIGDQINTRTATQNDSYAQAIASGDYIEAACDCIFIALWDKPVPIPKLMPKKSPALQLLTATLKDLNPEELHQVEQAFNSNQDKGYSGKLCMGAEGKPSLRRAFELNLKGHDKDYALALLDNNHARAIAALLLSGEKKDRPEFLTALRKASSFPPEERALVDENVRLLSAEKRLPRALKLYKAVLKTGYPRKAGIIKLGVALRRTPQNLKQPKLWLKPDTLASQRDDKLIAEFKEMSPAERKEEFLRLLEKSALKDKTKNHLLQKYEDMDGEGLDAFSEKRKLKLISWKVIPHKTYRFKKELREWMQTIDDQPGVEIDACRIRFALKNSEEEPELPVYEFLDDPDKDLGAILEAYEKLFGGSYLVHYAKKKKSQEMAIALEQNITGVEHEDERLKFGKVQLVYDCIVGTDYQGLMTELQDLSRADIQELKEKYSKTFTKKTLWMFSNPRDLEVDIINAFDGFEMEDLLEILEWGKPETLDEKFQTFKDRWELDHCDLEYRTRSAGEVETQLEKFKGVRGWIKRQFSLEFCGGEILSWAGKRLTLARHADCRAVEVYYNELHEKELQGGVTTDFEMRQIDRLIKMANQSLDIHREQKKKWADTVANILELAVAPASLMALGVIGVKWAIVAPVAVVCCLTARYAPSALNLGRGTGMKQAFKDLLISLPNGAIMGGGTWLKQAKYMRIFFKGPVARRLAITLSKFTLKKVMKALKKKAKSSDFREREQSIHARWEKGKRQKAAIMNSGVELEKRHKDFHADAVMTRMSHGVEGVFEALEKELAN